MTGTRLISFLLLLVSLNISEIRAEEHKQRTIEFDRINDAFESKLKELNKNNRTHPKYTGEIDAATEILKQIDQQAIDQYLLEAEVRLENFKPDPNELFPKGPFTPHIISKIFGNAVKNSDRDLIAKMLRRCPPSSWVHGSLAESFLVRHLGVNSFNMVFEAYEDPNSLKSARKILAETTRRSFGASPDWVIPPAPPKETDAETISRLKDWFSKNQQRLTINGYYGRMSMSLYNDSSTDSHRQDHHLIGLFWCPRKTPNL